MTLPQLNSLELRRIHSIFVELTRSEVRLDIGGYIESLWFNWLRTGYTEADLRMVIESLKSRIRKGERNQGALKFRHLIENTVNFGDELAEAKTNAVAEKRQRLPETPRQEILRATGRNGDVETHAKPAGQVIPKTEQEMRAFFAKCKAEAGLDI